jgi:hypothetical protein
MSRETHRPTTSQAARLRALGAVASARAIGSTRKGARNEGERNLETKEQQNRRARALNPRTPQSKYCPRI